VGRRILIYTNHDHNNDSANSILTHSHIFGFGTYLWVSTYSLRSHELDDYISLARIVEFFWCRWARYL